MRNTIKIVSDEIVELEKSREHDGASFSESDSEKLAVLKLCYGLLTRIKDGVTIIPNLPDDAFTDFIFALATGKGKINMRDFLRKVTPSYRKISRMTGIREATMSDYFTGKTSMTCDLYETILNSRQEYEK